MAVNEELSRFVRDALGRGVPRPQITTALEQAGWSREQIAGALASFAAVDFPIPVPRPRPSLSARDAFQYLLLFTTMYLVAFNTGSLLFQFIDRAFVDPAAALPDSYSRNSIRWAVSSLIAALPVFLFLSRITTRAARIDPTKRTSAVRRWLTYLTLFVAACVLIGDLMSVIYNFLGGELTVRFFLKALTIGAIAGTIFWYYLVDLRADEAEPRS